MAMTYADNICRYMLLGEAFTLVAQGRPVGYAIAPDMSDQVWRLAWAAWKNYYLSHRCLILTDWDLRVGEAPVPGMGEAKQSLMRYGTAQINTSFNSHAIW